MSNQDEERQRLDGFLQRMQPMIEEFHSIVDRACRDDPAMRDWRAADFAYDLLQGSIRPLVTGMPEGRYIDPDAPKAWTPDRRQLVELVARTIEHRSKRWDGRRVLPVENDWKSELRGRYPGMFKCEVSIGSGWADLLTAYTEMRIELGDAPVYAQIKEKYGELRAYESGEFRGLEWTLMQISGCICEDCGAPGRERNGRWIRTICDRHADGGR